MKKLLILIALQFSAMVCVSAVPPGFEMGKPVDQWKADITKDISNPQSWEETKFEYGKTSDVYGVQAQKTTIAFWNGRLYYVEMTLPEDAWYTLKPILDKEYGAPWALDSVSGYFGMWGDTKQPVSVVLSKGYYTTISFQDDTQKEFHFGDLFKGVLLWIIVTIVGLFVLNWFIAWILTSYCKRCKTFNMKIAGTEIGRDKNYSTEIFGADMHHDTTYKYKCAKCGHVRKDRYSGFFNYMRSKD